MRAVDTNVLMRLLVRDDAKQLNAAETFVASGAWVSHVVLVEAMWVLDSVYGATAERIASTIEMLLEHEQLVLQEPDVIAEAVRMLRKRPKLGFSDCLVLEIARKAGHAPLGTFDRDLAKVEGTNKL